MEKTVTDFSASLLLWQLLHLLFWMGVIFLIARYIMRIIRRRPNG